MGGGWGCGGDFGVGGNIGRPTGVSLPELRSGCIRRKLRLRWPMHSSKDQ